MGKFRLTPLIVSIVGSVLTIGIPVAVFFLLIQPEQAKITAQEAAYQQNAAYVGPAPLAKANQTLKDAQTQVAEAEDRWDSISREKNPDIDMSDRFLAWRQLTRELEFTLGPLVEHWLPHSGIQPLGMIYLDAPSPDPNAVPQSIIAIPLRMAPFQSTGGNGGGGGGGMPSGGGGGAPGGAGGGSMSVLGSFTDILKHVENWNKFNRIVLIDTVNVSGYSPIVTGTYNATVYILPTNGDKIGAPVPSGAAAAGPGGAGLGR